MNVIPTDVNIMLTIALFIVNAVIGGVAYVFFHSIGDRNLIIRHLILAGIAGYVYWNLYSNYNLPNAFVSLIVGWFAPDFIQAIMEKYKPKGNGT